MKSKTSCFNKTIFKKNITHFWPIWLVYIGYLLFILPINLWLNMAGYNRWDTYTQAQKQLSALNDTLNAAINPAVTFVFAGIAILAVFSYLYSARNANMIHALPVNRLELFVTNIMSAGAFLIIPQTIVFVITVFVCIAARITYIQYILFWYGTAVGIGIFALAMGSFVAMLTGNIVAFPFYYLIANFLYVGSVMLVGTLINTICFGVSQIWEPGRSGMLSPMYFLAQNVGIKQITDKTYAICGIEMRGSKYVAIYVVLAVLFLVLAYQLYKRRQIETAGDLVCIRGIKPIFRWGVGIGAGTELGIVLTDTVQCRVAGNQVLFGLLVACILLMETLCFFGAEMLLQKSFRVFKKKRVAEWAAMAVVSVALLGALQMDLFGIEGKVPEVSEIKSASVNLDYKIRFEGEEAEQVTELQREIISHKEEYLACEDVSYVNFVYKMKDGSELQRSYPVPVSEEYLEDEDSTVMKIIDMEAEPDRIRQYLFGKNYEKNEYYAGSIDFYVDGGRDEDYHFSKEELSEILDAVNADIEDGTLGKYQLMSIWAYKKEADGGAERYYNNLNISYYNPDGVIRMDTEYYTETTIFGVQSTSGVVEADENEDYEYEKNSNAFIQIGSDCTHLLDVFQKLGITNEKRKLMTNEEYNEQVNAYAQ